MLCLVPGSNNGRDVEQIQVDLKVFCLPEPGVRERLAEFLSGQVKRIDCGRNGAASSMAASRIGSARGVIEKIMDSSRLWNRCLCAISDDAAKLKIQGLLHERRETGRIDESSSLESASH